MGVPAVFCCGVLRGEEQAIFYGSFSSSKPCIQLGLCDAPYGRGTSLSAHLIWVSFTPTAVVLLSRGSQGYFGVLMLLLVSSLAQSRPYSGAKGVITVVRVRFPKYSWFFFWLEGWVSAWGMVG